MRNALISVLKKHPLLCILLFLTVIGAAVLALLPPLVLERIVNGLTKGNAVSVATAVWYFALLAFGGLTAAGREVLITVLGQKITHAVRHAMSEKLDRLPAAYFVAHPAGEVSSRFVNDADALCALFDNGVISMAADGCQLIFVLVMIFSRSIGMGILTLVLLPFVFVMTRAFQKKMLRAQLENRSAIARVNDRLPQTVRNRRMIRSFAKQAYMERRYDELLDDSYRAVESSNLCDALYSPIINLISAVLIAVLMVFSAGGRMESLFGLSVGGAVAMIVYIGKFFSPVEALGMEIQNIQSAAAGMKRIRAFFAEPERRLPDGTAKPEANPVIDLANVTFGYDPENPILRDFSMRVARGERVTLAGRTGAGKSTVFKLLLGLYVPESGSVCVFGAPAEEIPDGEKRRLFGYVGQTFRPIPGTVGEQITMKDPEITPDMVQQAARTVGLDSVIAAMPDGYDTPFSASLFSQGQLQLLHIARAVAPQPPLLLLDEITAGLDSATEETVLNALDHAAKNRTTLSVSHRLFEKTGAGRIIRIDAQ